MHLEKHFFSFITQIRLEDFEREDTPPEVPTKKRKTKSFEHPVDLELEHVLGSMPRKVGS